MGRKAGGGASREGIENGVARIGAGQDDPLQKGKRFLGGMFPILFLGLPGCCDGPDGAHLEAGFLQFVFGEVTVFHGLVMEGMPGVFVFFGPEQGLVACGEIAAGKVRGGVGFEPGDVV